MSFFWYLFIFTRNDKRYFIISICLWLVGIRSNDNGCQTNKIFQSGDEITLTLDCENEHILLRHHRTNKFVQHAIDIQLCPLPWKILLRLYGAVSRIRILQ